MIDSFNNIYPVLDRLEIQEILLHLEDFKTEGRSTVRGPHFLKVLCLYGFLVMELPYQVFFSPFQFNHGILLSERLIGIYLCLLLYAKINLNYLILGLFECLK